MLVESKAPPASGDSAGSALEQLEIPGFLHVTRRRELESLNLNACILTCFHTSIITIAKFLVVFFTMCRRTSRTVQGEGEVEHAMFSGATSDDNAN